MTLVDFDEQMRRNGARMSRMAGTRPDTGKALLASLASSGAGLLLIGILFW